MAFLTDTLIDIGLKANPKNNLSMATQGQKMLEVLRDYRENKGYSLRKLQCTMDFVCKELNKAGYPWYETSKFFT